MVLSILLLVRFVARREAVEVVVVLTWGLLAWAPRRLFQIKAGYGDAAARLGWWGQVSLPLSDSRIHFQSPLGAACVVWAFYDAFLAALGPSLMLSCAFRDKSSSRRFTARQLEFARLILWNAG